MVLQVPNGGHVVRFWRLDGSQPVNDWSVPKDFTPRAIAWHPLGDRFFLAGIQGGQQVIARVSKVSGSWQMKTVYRSTQEIRRLVVGPRPYVIAYDKAGNPTEGYRLFFGMKGTRWQLRHPFHHRRWKQGLPGGGAQRRVHVLSQVPSDNRARLRQVGRCRWGSIRPVIS